MTVAYNPRTEWAREDREAARKPAAAIVALGILDPFWQTRITAAADDRLTQWLTDSEGQQSPWRTALLAEAATRWYTHTSVGA